ncbi:4Fe-4S dicluster domain-containing protein [Emticicia sp. 21SJ11W-3]|uniref:4Fe-4S dicluster domain-containing protein n=1 Tax=Emticicia sp. 21SJ11W-3 TaxID=2916755 RepID=UPI0020A0E401|nr:4Fe-4S dicluster domain-containing protein [Emticicia sp. 21SJ11W-3]UTA68629.1 4Fe-4S dicluster domain-containing protein [Emticicia sp. 21SJ11W-3]
MQVLAQILFVAALATAGFFIGRRVKLIKKTILLGQAEDRTDRPAERLKTMLLIAFGQKKMFNRPIVGLMHFIIYAGFLIINIEVLEIMLDGILGTHRLFYPLLGSLYGFLINFFELLALGVVAVCLVFLIRRNVIKVPRFQESRHREMTSWPRTDANIILITEVLLMWAFLSMNAADTILQQRGLGHYAEASTGNFLVSQWLQPVFNNWSDTALVTYERIAWWFHILGIMGFALYVTYSKHLHIFLAFPNTYFSNLDPKGEMHNMPAVTKEVKIMLGIEQPDATPAEVGRFGAKDVKDLSWKNLMDAYSCTECGRCTAACPANITGKKLSPRKIMMDTRDRLEEIQKGWLQNGYEYDSGKTLLGDYITEEEILACTTCNACVQQCPVNISPLDIILQLRRYKVMEESSAPGSWNAMFSNLENNMAPWKLSPGDRFNWAENLNNP